MRRDTEAEAGADLNQDLPRASRRWAMFLDFDGTLAEIAARPDLVVIDKRLPEALRALRDALDGAVAIISGRPRAELDAMLAPLVLPIAGLHGLERRRADGSMVSHNGLIREIEQVRRSLTKAVAGLAGLQLEDKGLSLALHYRGAPERHDECRAIMDKALDEHRDCLDLLNGKMVFEIRPKGIDKGHAIEAFLDEPPFSGRIPVFVGDDITDEDGFAVVNRLGGITVHVGATAATGASWRVSSVDRLLAWLQESASHIAADTGAPVEKRDNA